jgi:glycosyltransferase involved in cell wall biosynthesis
LGGSGHLIVDVGMIKPLKGFDVLVRAASVVCRHHPNTQFVIVGGVNDAGYYAGLRALVSELGLDRNLHFAGLQSDANPYLRMADVFCHLSRTDGLSNALLEAMGSGLPCVISRVGGNPEVVEEGGNGFIVDSDDFEAAAGRLIRLLNDPEAAARFGGRSREIVEEKYTVDGMVRSFVALYDELLQPLNGRRR